MAPADLYVCMAYVAALQAGWTLLQGVDLTAAEYAARAYYLDSLPVRFRRFVGKVARWHGQFIPYLYINFKAKCFKGPIFAPHTCTTPGHSCTRKVVSYFRMYGRRLNRQIHRGCQVNLEQLPTWELWSLRTAPK